MEAGMLVLTAIGVVIAGASAAFAWVQARSAVESLKDAREARDEARESAKESARLASEANEAFVRQAEAQEEANRLKVKEMTPDDWSGPALVSGQLYRVTNTSGRVLLVSDIDIQPERLAGLVRIRTEREDGRYEAGDVIEYMSIETMGGGAEKIVVSYTKEGSEQPHQLTIRL